MSSARTMILSELESPHRTLSRKITPLHPKQIVKRIQACGNNYTAALDVLYAAQPFLTPTNVDEASTKKDYLPPMKVNYGTFDAKPICCVIYLLSKNNQFSLALDLLDDVKQQHNAKIIPTYYLNAVYKSIISMLAMQEQKQKQNIHQQIQRYIYHDIPYNTNAAPPLDIYHISLSAFGKCRQIDAMLDLLNDLELQKSMTIPSTATGMKLQYELPAPDRMVYLTVLTGSIRCKASHHSIEILERMIKRGIKPDKVIYSHVLSSLANTKSEGRYDTAKQIWDEMEKENAYSNTAYKSLIRLFSKENQWADVTVVREKLKKISMQNGNGDIGVDVASIPTDMDRNSPACALVPKYLEDLAKLQKMDNAKKNWYKLGSVVISKDLEIIFGIQTHRNPILNGLSLVFYDSSGEKLGFMLIRNQLEQLSHDYKEKIFLSSIFGMLVDERHRGKGLSKIFMAIWLRICINSKAFPRSEKINKPLLSLVLTRFGFVSTSDSAIEVEICPIAHASDYDINSSGLAWEPVFAMYSRSPLNFGERELRIQKMIITQRPPSPKGKSTLTKTVFKHPITQKIQQGKDYTKDFTELSNLVEDLLGQTHNITSTLDGARRNSTSTNFHFLIDDKTLHRVIFGYLF